MLRRDDAGWTNPKVIAILAVVFLCGSAFGAAVMREYLHAKFMPPAGRDFIYHGKRIDFDTLKTDLNLSKDQERTVSQVLDDFGKYYQNLEEQRDDVAEAGKRRIVAVLSPDQRLRFYRLFREQPPSSDQP
ncbi:MAG TPA: hypothetical protein VN737_20395 [Bryobacteraceae bacterium]|jgi:hypothetical protein|nr:hypothetical protein [Bryobacteraceae bacterium]